MPQTSWLHRVVLPVAAVTLGAALVPPASAGPAPGQRPQDSSADRAATDATRALSADPGEPGPYGTTSSHYSLDPVRVPNLPMPVELAGHVVAPTGAPGPRPLVLLLHGWHQSCYLPGTDQWQVAWPCPQGWEPLPSHLGYRYIQRLLASQGYVTVSIAANALNGQDTPGVQDSPDSNVTARAALVRRHLALWGRWAADPTSPWSGRVDMDEVTLVGHSRGGEAVNRVAIDVPASAPYAINGLVLIAPTDFGRQAAPNVSTVTLLGYCDGDLTGLEGQGYADVGRDLAGDSALRSSVLVMGANHNYFNTEWTPGPAAAFAEDDWRDPDDPVCGTDAPTRLSAAEQRKVAATYVAGAVRLHARRDNGVLPMFDGSTVRVPSAGEADVRSTAVGGRRQMIPVRQDVTVRTSGPMSARTCDGRSSGPEGVCGEGVQPERTPHWPVGDQSPYRPGPPALEVAWTGAAGSATLRLGEPLDLSGSTSVDARVIVGTATPRVRLGLRLQDADGTSIVLDPRDEGRLRALPGRYPLGKLLAQTMRTPLAGVTEVDLTRITGVGVVSRTERGRIWLLDVAGRRPGLAPPSTSSVPVVGLMDVKEPEGSAADPQEVTLTLRTRGALREPTRVVVRAVEPAGNSVVRRTSVLLQPGEPTATFTVPYERDDRDDFPDTSKLNVLVFSTTGTVVTGDYAAVVTIRDDDPAPDVTVAPVDGTAVEGTDVRWRIGLSEPIDSFESIGWRVVRADGGLPQLRSDDVPARWLRSRGVTPPQRPVPLWQLDDLRGNVDFHEDRQQAVVRIPTREDDRAEGRELVALRFESERFLPEPLVRVAVVRDGSD